jgi:hypothetical protein
MDERLERALVCRLDKAFEELAVRVATRAVRAGNSANESEHRVGWLSGHEIDPAAVAGLFLLLPGKGHALQPFF